jgi:L-alanine-DL-glutamate epimerase-like enolase superfamily enzyme
VKIADVRVTPPIGPFEWTLVRVDTDDGLSGYGELPIFSRVAADDLAQVRQALVGKRPHDVEPLLAPLLGAFEHARNVGLVHGVEIALLDLVGKALGAPVYVLLGGKYRSRVRMYADSHGGIQWTPDGIRARVREVAETGRFLDVYTPSAYGQHAGEVCARGFTAVKFDVDFPTPHKLDVHDRSIAPAELRGIVRAVEAIREGVGPDVDVAIDLHARYNVADALRVAYELEPYRLMWLEDPIPPGNHEAMAKVTAKARVPICTGESLVGREEFRDLIVRQAADVLQPDTPKACGMRDLKKIADLADLYSVSIAPHNMTSPIGTIAAVHACAAVPNFLALEFHCQVIDWWDSCLAGDAPLIQQGYIAVPEQPGLGIEPDEAVLAAHCQGPLWG